MNPWYASPYTGLFTRFGPIPLRPHDPEVYVTSGLVAPAGPRRQPLTVGGAGWDAAAAEAACVGEAVERLRPYRFADDQAREARYDHWALDEPAIDPARWVLFHPHQYAQPGFPFEPLRADTTCRWVCFREAGTGLPHWVPEELAYLFTPVDAPHRFAPGVSTGLSCGRFGDPVLLRGLQEVVERDAVVGAWWGNYPLEEWDPADVFTALPADAPRRLQRPNLTYRFFRVRTPFSAHAAVVLLTGEDREGYCVSVGSACRETRPAAWLKATVEAVHGRHYVRHLLASNPKSEIRNPKPEMNPYPRDFAEHGVYYSFFPDRLRETAFARAVLFDSTPSDLVEGWETLAERLGPTRPILFRTMTPPDLAAEGLGWYVLRVLVPGLQPLHGNHALPHLGGPFWTGRDSAGWANTPPHPFP